MYDLEEGLQPKVPKRNYRNFLFFSIILNLQQMTIQSAVKRCDDMVNMWNCAAPTELLDLFVPLFSTNISLLRSSSPFHVDSFIIIEFFWLFFYKHHY